MSSRQISTAARRAAGARKIASSTPSPRRSPLTFVDPEELVIPGEESALFDGHRAALPVREEDVVNVLHYSVVEPLVARLSGGRVEVVDGKQRVRWAREANRRLRERGERPMRVPVVLRICDDREAFGVSVSLNEIRHGDSFYTKAHKAARLTKLGMRAAEVAVVFGVSESLIYYWLNLFKLAPDLQQEAAEGRLGVREAANLAKIPGHDDQRRAFAELRAGAQEPDKTEQQHASVGMPVGTQPQANGQGGSASPDARGATSHHRPRLRDLAVYVTEVDRAALDPAWSMLLLWLLGDDDTTEDMVVGVLPQLGPFFEWRRGRGEP